MCDQLLTHYGKSSWTLSLSRVLWISPSKAGISLGLIIGILLCGLESTSFSFRSVGWTTSQMRFRVDYREFSQVTFLFS